MGFSVFPLRLLCVPFSKVCLSQLLRKALWFRFAFVVGRIIPSITKVPKTPCAQIFAPPKVNLVNLICKGSFFIGPVLKNYIVSIFWRYVPFFYLGGTPARPFANIVWSAILSQP